MNAITAIATERKTIAPAEDGKTELLLASLRGAILRARLDINEFTTIGSALRSGMITPDEAIEWLRESGLIGQVDQSL
jgi:hypothetical protein